MSETSLEWPPKDQLAYFDGERFEWICRMADAVLHWRWPSASVDERQHAILDAVVDLLIEVEAGMIDAKQFPDQSRFLHYAGRWIAFRAGDYLRRESRRNRILVERAELLAPRPEKDEGETLDLKDDILWALGHLTSKERTIVILRFWEEMPMSRISDAIGLPVQTCYRRFYTALSKLRQAIQGDSQ